MNSQEIKAMDAQYVLPTYARFDLCLVEGKGCRAKDPEGNTYLDFTSGIGVNSLGWCDDEWVAAVAAQAGKLQHTSNIYYTQPGIELAKALCERTGMNKVFFANSGAEANEGAIKAARKYSKVKYGEGRHVILTLQNSFHGRTMAALSATGQESFHKDFAPFPAGFRYLPAEDATLLGTALENDVCAVMLEPIQGEGGVVPFSEDYMQMVRGLCDERDILMICDEVQTGVGRTGSFLASQGQGVQPDIVTLAKGLGGGLPIGALLLGEKCQSALQKGDHATTFGMNPVVCAGALVVMDRLDDTFLQAVTAKGEILRKGLQNLPGVESVSGKGLMLGVTFMPHIAASTVVKTAIGEGLLCLTAKEKMRLLPPLVISEAEIEEGLRILYSTLDKLPKV